MIIRILRICLPVISFVCFCRAQDSFKREWQDLIKDRKCKDAHTLCSVWIADKNISKQVEGHKCLANVALCGTETVTLQATDDGGGSMSSGYAPQAVDEALEHLNQALKLAPQDLSIHLGRLHILEVSFRYSDMTKALDESCTVYKGQDVDTWLPYTAELFNAKQFRAALDLLEVLNRHYPNSHDVLGNMGAMYSMLKEDEHAIPYLLKATELAPTDPIDAWNLGREYDFVGKNDLADQWYKKALALEPDSDEKKQRVCTYAEFVERKLQDPGRACDLQKTNCPDHESACTSKK